MNEGTKSDGGDNTHVSPAHADYIRNARVVCFDVDSTVLTYEGIDVLAEYHGCGHTVAQYTSAAMNGQTTFQDALAERLNIISPNYDVMERCINEHPCTMTNGIHDLIYRLHARGTDVYLISGGFKQMIVPAARKLEIPDDHIYANVLLFAVDPPHTFIGFDSTQPTSRTGGKRIAMQHIKQAKGVSSDDVIMIGDGVTDLEARTECGMFIGYGGVAKRHAVMQQADLFIVDWKQILTYV